MKRTILKVLSVYVNLISPLFPPRCRFYPSCSRYCYEAVEHYGVLKGLFLGFGRILRCHPFNAGGYDPLPK